MDKKTTAAQRKYIGGQAVIEGVMMRGETMYAMAVRGSDGAVQVEKKAFGAVEKKLPFLKWPIFRGVVMFVDSLVTGMRIITRSAEMSGLMEDEPEGNEKPAGEQNGAKPDSPKSGEKQGDAMIYLSVALAIVLAVGIFMLLPVLLGSFFKRVLGGNTWALGIIEGLIRVVIFLLYVYLISLSKEIRRVYQYHGAEHKTINCYESGDELTVPNVRGRSRLHKRCGTSFLLIVMLISMVVFFFVRTNSVPLRILSRLLLVPVIAGLSYEVIRWAGRNDNRFVRAVSFPGMCVQRLTTAEPDDSQIETAIAAMNGVLESEGGGAAAADESGKTRDAASSDAP